MPLENSLVNYSGWQSLHMTNGIIEAFIPLEIGLRVMHFGFVGKENQFAVIEDDLGNKGGDKWRIYGGHRLWHAPETRQRTYTMDNAPLVDVGYHFDFCRFVQAIDHAGIEKQIDFGLSEDGASVTVTHRLINRNAWHVEVSAWSLSIMAKGGTAILPMPPYGSHETNLLPAGRINLWGYTDLSDKRFTIGKEYTLLRQDSTAKVPQKIGIASPQGWLGYVNNGTLFVKKAHFIANATYPDFGSSLEVFTDHAILELETLSPLVTLAPNAQIEHTEEWRLFDNVPTPQTNQDVIDHIAPLLG